MDNIVILPRQNTKTILQIIADINATGKLPNDILEVKEKYEPLLKKLGIIDNILPWQEIALYYCIASNKPEKNNELSR